MCRWITPTDNRLHVLVLQHPQEAAHAKGSARLLALSLAQCDCLVGDVFDEAALSVRLAPPGRSRLLFPEPAAQAVDKGPLQPVSPGGIEPAPVGGPVEQLVLLDGTWRQAGRLLRDHPSLQALARWSLSSLPPSRYRIRAAPRPQAQRSTLEAACLALGALEQRPQHYTALLSAFSGWVETVAARVPARRAEDTGCQRGRETCIAS